MLTVMKRRMAIFVDRSSGQWIVQDGDGSYWVIPPTDNPWHDRQRFTLTEETELEPVPGHYKYMLGLPD